MRSRGARHLENNAREVSVKLLASACEGEVLRGEAGHMEQLSSTRLGNLDCPRKLHSEATAIQDRVAKKQQQDAGKGYCSSCRDLEERKAVIFLQKKKYTSTSLPLLLQLAVSKYRKEGSWLYKHEY